MKRVLVIADVPNWAWGRKAEQLRRHLSGDEFAIDIAYAQSEPLPADYDLYHTFEVNQLNLHGIRVEWPATTGITAHVWQTWEMQHGKGSVRAWAARARAFHANSVLLQKEMEEYLGRQVYYCPNGVDETFFRRTRMRVSNDRLVVGWVGKPNVRKGHDIVEEACRIAGVEFRAVRRKFNDALSPEEMREFYQDLHVLAVASDMDGTPNPALEAAACEVAVVSNRIGNMPEFIVEFENGLLVKREAEAYALVFAAMRDGKIAHAEMGKRARETVERDWTWKKMAQNYARMWREVLA